MSGKYVTETLGAEERGLRRAAAILASGGLVAVPTETVYGLAARADDEAAVARIYEAKGRPSFNPLIVHVSSIEMARALAAFSATAEHLAKAHWPGPLTLVLPRRQDAGLQKVLIPQPHPVFCRQLRPRQVCRCARAAPGRRAGQRHRQLER